MEKINAKYIKKCITSASIFGFLTYILITTKDWITRIVVIPFLIFSLFFCIEKILLIINKNKLAKKVSKVYVIAFFVYWFGFLICWDYISIFNKDFMSVLFSLPLWFGGGYIISKRFRNKNEEEK